MFARFAPKAVLACFLLAAIGARSAPVLVRLCASSRSELQMCQQFLSIAPLNRVCPTGGQARCVHYSCVLSDGETCVDAIHDGAAEMAVADPVTLHAYHSLYQGAGGVGLKVVASEVHGAAVDRSCGDSCDNTVFGVAFATAATCAAHPGLTLADTRGFASCHGEYGDLAGWVLPVTTLKNRGYVSKGSDVDMIEAFYDTSCAPSDSDTRLCSGCADSSAAGSCALDTTAFGGPSGVLDCVRQTPDSIGFVDQFTLLGSGNKGESGLANANNFRLVTMDLGCKEISKYELAGYNLGPVPATAVVASITLDPTTTDEVRADLAAAGAAPAFQALFSTGNNTAGALFTAGTDGLAPTTVGTSDVTVYLGPLGGVLDQYSTFAEDPTATAQDTPLQTFERTVKEHPDWAMGLMFGGGFLSALLCVGCGCLLCRVGRSLRSRRKFASTERGEDLKVEDGEEKKVNTRGVSSFQVSHNTQQPLDLNPS